MYSIYGKQLHVVLAYYQLTKLTVKQLKLTTSTVEFDAEANDLGVVYG